MEQQFFGVSLEKLLTSGGQTLYMVALALTSHRNDHRNDPGTDPGAL